MRASIGYSVQYKPEDGSLPPIAGIVTHVGVDNALMLSLFPPRGGVLHQSAVRYTPPQEEWKPGTCADVGRPV